MRSECRCDAPGRASTANARAPTFTMRSFSSMLCLARVLTAPPVRTCAQCSQQSNAGGAQREAPCSNSAPRPLQQAPWPCSRSHHTWPRRVQDDDAPSQPSTPPPDPNAVSNFDLGAGVAQLLAAKGIAALFDIQSACFGPAMDGKDIVGRARTGCGKTLAFVLPIVTLLMKEGIKPIAGGPNVICLLPTRELAKQVRYKRTADARERR